jgi:small-conductance mechanosensitive channel
MHRSVLGSLALVLTLQAIGPPGILAQDTTTASVDADSLVAAQTDSAGADTLTTDSSAVVDAAPEAISQERSVTDEEVRSRLQALFDRVAALSDVTVEVEAGIVRIRGTVADGVAGERAVALAEAQSGVLWVEDDIALTASLSKRLEPTWARLRDLAFGAVALLPLLAVALGIVLLSLFLGSALGRWGGPSFLRSRNPFLQNIVGRAIQTALVLAGLLVALDLLEATALVGAVAGTAGLAGLALGFAFKDIVENYLAGLLLALRRPFDQNDQVVVEAFEGKVVRLTPRETILMTSDGNHVRVPNALVFRSPMLNYTRNPRRRFQFEAGVGPVDDLALARETGIAVLREMEGVLDDPAPDALVIDLGDSSVTMRFMGWVDQRQAEFSRVRSEAIRLVKLRLEAAGVSLPSPEYLVRMAAEPDVGASAPGATAPSVAPVVVEEVQADVSVDDAVDRQIEEDRRSSGEENLLGGNEISPRPGLA